MRCRIAATAVVLLLAVFPAVAGPEGLPGFEPLQTGPGAAGRWDAVVDADGTDGRAVEQSSDDPTEDRFPLLIRMATEPADVTVRARIKPVSGSVDQAGGLALRLLDRNNYYLVRANALEGNVQFYSLERRRPSRIAPGRTFHVM